MAGWKPQEIENEEKKTKPMIVKKDIVEPNTEKTFALDDLSFQEKTSKRKDL